MKPVLHACSLAVVLLASSLVACADRSDEPSAGRGELGRATFTYDGFGCFDACSVDEPIAKGAHVVVVARGDDPSAPYRARIVGGDALVVEDERAACTCREEEDNGSSEFAADGRELEAAGDDVRADFGASNVLDARGNGMALTAGPGDVSVELDGLGVTSTFALQVTPER